MKPSKPNNQILMISPTTAAIIGNVLNIMDLSQRYSQDMLVGFPYIISMSSHFHNF
jgi:hypothetical protein